MTEIKVNPAEIEFFQQNGYIQYHDFLSKGQIELLRQALDDAVSTRRDRIRGAEKGGRLSEEYERVFNQMVNLWTDYPQARDIAFDPRLGEYARQLSLCRHVRIYHDHAMIKPPGQVSKQTNWHQDAPYWPMDPVGALSAWIAVDDVTIENGCLHFVPGSHSHGPLDPISLESDDDSVVERLRTRGIAVPGPVAMPMRAGGVTFHHGCTFHYAGPNRSDRPRRAFAIIYIPDYTRFTGGKDAAGAAEEMKIGGPWNHAIHPIVAGH
ncbi:MAG: phytanoyl-CoA dioxygenase family protein [Caldilineaceae bacterium]|nr:phytanoyl-CoA dioxygenase family protein [Caldilineaceae bacterium]